MLNKSDNGVYVCHADNGIGSSEGEYTLLVQGKEKKQKEGKKGSVVTERGRRGTLGCFLSSSRFFIPSFVCCGFACTSIFFSLLIFFCFFPPVFVFSFSFFLIQPRLTTTIQPLSFISCASLPLLLCDPFIQFVVVFALCSPVFSPAALHFFSRPPQRSRGPRLPKSHSSLTWFFIFHPLFLPPISLSYRQLLRLWLSFHLL